MPDRLTVILSGRTLERRELEETDEKLVIGRSPECDITIENNVAVSRMHCELTSLGGVWQVRDLGSDNGTYVNGKRIKQRYNLNSGDMIELGKHSLRFDQSPPPDLDGTPKPSTGKMTARVGFRPAHQVRGYLDIKGHPPTLIEKPVFLMGKRNDCDLKLSGWTTPGVVALVISGGSGFRLLDVSTQADSVKVNGVQKRDYWLNENDHLTIRGQEMRFHRGRPVG